MENLGFKKYLARCELRGRLDDVKPVQSSVGFCFFMLRFALPVFRDQCVFTSALSA